MISYTKSLTRPPAKVYVAYFFHHDNPLRGENHLNMRIVKTAQRIKDGSEEKVHVGNLSVIKEFNFASDLMEAVWLLVNQNGVYEVVIGSGKGHSILDWVKCCFDLTGKDWETRIDVAAA